MIISEKMRMAVENSSMVRRMFEDGIRLKAKYGVSNVFDYSLGNPDLSPPADFNKVLTQLIKNEKNGTHGYMPNSGWPETRHKLSLYLDRVQGIGEGIIKDDSVVFTVGAAGAMNSAFKAILNPGDKVMVLAPFFMEYAFYASNHGGQLQIVQTTSDFRPDFSAIQKAITKKTRALIINSPNNPTGVIYTKEELVKLGEILRQASDRIGHSILLISDEPYRKLAFDVEVPKVFLAYDESIVVSSFSKDLSLAGERIGYLVANPNMAEHTLFMEAVILANRILGFVNAPSMMQLAVVNLLEKNVDLQIYQKRQSTLVKALSDIGYTLTQPQGTFYLFPKSPIEDLSFVEILKKELILAVPGTGFGRPGYFRLSLCLSQEMVEKSLPGFEKAYKKALKN